jgi:hypothetical protein
MKGEAEPYMIPFNMYAEGSYFGDNDVLGDYKKNGRDGTALVYEKSIVYVLEAQQLLDVLDMFRSKIKKEMYTIAEERKLHH